MKLSGKLLATLFIIILTLPLAAYINQFGIGFWSTHQDWSNLGSYFGGIYSPILTIFTLILIFIQIHLQHQQHQQTLIQHQEKTLAEYINELNNELNSEYTQEDRVRDFLIKLFRDQDSETIGAIDPAIIFNFNERHHKIYSMWCGVMGCLSALENYSPSYGATSKNYVVAYLNPQMCRTIDKYHYAFNAACKALGVTAELPKLKYTFWAMYKGA